MSWNQAKRKRWKHQAGQTPRNSWNHALGHQCSFSGPIGRWLRVAIGTTGHPHMSEHPGSVIEASTGKSAGLNQPLKQMALGVSCEMLHLERLIGLWLSYHKLDSVCGTGQTAGIVKPPLGNRLGHVPAKVALERLANHALGHQCSFSEAGHWSLAKRTHILTTWSPTYVEHAGIIRHHQENPEKKQLDSFKAFIGSRQCFNSVKFSVHWPLAKLP